MKLNNYQEGDDIDVFISRLESIADLYKMELEEKAFAFLSLFPGKALSLIHCLLSDESSYEDIKKALRTAYCRTAKNVKIAIVCLLCSFSLGLI